MYEVASNARVKLFIVLVKSVTNSTLFCWESELCSDFVLCGVILMAFCDFFKTFTVKTEGKQKFMT